MTRAELLALPLNTPVRIRVGPQLWDGTIYSRSGGVVMVRTVTLAGNPGAMIEARPEDVTCTLPASQPDLFGGQGS